MHDAQLDLGLGEDRLDGIREALQPVDGRDEDVLDTAVLEFRQYAEPELRPLGLAYPEPQEFLLALKIYGQRQVDRLTLDVARVSFPMSMTQVFQGA